MFRSLKKGFESTFTTPPRSHTLFKNTTLKFNSTTVRLGEVIAEGGYSFIHIACAESTKRRYAVKRISYDNNEGKRKGEAEIKILKSLKSHPNVVAFYDSIIDHNNIFLLFDLMDGGTLLERMKQKQTCHEQQLKIFDDIICSICHLHASKPAPIAYRDMKLENVLYDRFKKCYKLCDFGSCTTKTYTTENKTRNEIMEIEEDVSENCTTLYCAPELIDLYSGYFICEKIDIWSLGCVFHAILFGRLPFNDGCSTLTIMNGLSSENLPKFPKYPKHIIDILLACFTIHPCDRPDCFALLKVVRKVRNQPFEQTYENDAFTLRRLRNNDFGRPPKSLDICISLPNVQHRTKTDDDDVDDWADFSSAFGTATTTTANSVEFESLIDFSTTANETCSKPSAAHADHQTDLLASFQSNHSNMQ